MTLIDPLTELTSNRSLVRQKIAAYLERGLAEGGILSAGRVFAHPPKLTKQSDLYDLALPGQPDGAAIFLYLTGQDEYRIALGGVPSRTVPGSGGRKGRVYALSLLCYLFWKGPEAEGADEANDAFIDSLTNWIQADRNAVTQATTLGGDGSGVIFCWGEGPNPGSIPGGKDVTVHTAFPKHIRGEGVMVFNIVDVSVIAILQT